MNEEMLNECMAIVHELKNRNVILNGEGIYDKKAVRNWVTLPFNTFKNPNPIPEPVPFTREEIQASGEAILKAIKIIPFVVKKTTRKGLVGSYALKHCLEKTFFVENNGSYLENGQAILAMLYLKYGMKLSEEGSWNCTFHCDYAKNDYYSEHYRIPDNLKF